MKDYLEEKKLFEMECEPSVKATHLSTDPDLLLTNGPEKNYAKDLKMTKRPLDDQIAYTPFEKFIA